MSDDALLNEFAASQSEGAFAALVRRHVDLVFGTALRQLGDTGLAEEVTQNVFIAMARKSGRLGRHTTIAAWLYKTTLLEARQRLRSELRRKHREFTAAELGTLHSQPDSPWAALIPLLDEALMRLRDTDRLALVLRYLEGRSLRDVGQVLGISEDAAQKRVAKSLTAVTHFFEQQGIPVPAVAGVAAGATLLQHAVVAAPAHLAGSVTTAAMTQAGSGLATSTFLLKIMSLTKVQTAVLCIAIVAFPVAFDAAALRREAGLRLQAASRLAGHQQPLEAAEAALDAARARLSDTNNAMSRATLLARRSTMQAEGAAARAWSDESLFARIPKSLLGELKIPAMTPGFELRQEIIAALGMRPSEVAVVNQCMVEFSATMRGLAEANLRPTAQHVSFTTLGEGEKRSFEIAGYADAARAAHAQLRERLDAALGADRAELLVQQVHALVQPGSTSFTGRKRLVTLVHTPRAKEPRLYVEYHDGGKVMSAEGDLMPDPATPDAVRTLFQAWSLPRRP